MKLTEKDKAFLENLSRQIHGRDLWVELRPDRPSYLVLRGAYGERLHEAFGMSRQGVRWRFHRLINEIYVSAFETILFVEKTLGAQLREDAVRISRERHRLRQRMTADGFVSADTLAERNEEEAADRW